MNDCRKKSYLADLYDDTYPTCERTCAQFRIDPGSMSPEDVTRLLAITPTTKRTKGSVRIGYAGKEIVSKKSVWLLSSEPEVKSKDLRRHLDWLLDRLEKAMAPLNELQCTEGIRMDVNCIWWSAHGHGGPILNASQMHRISALDLQCGFDIYFFPEKD